MAMVYNEEREESVQILESRLSVANNQLNGIYSEMMVPRPNWDILLTGYHYFFSQMEGVRDSTIPPMQLKVVEPRRSTENVHEIPFLLSTMVSPEDKSLITDERDDAFSENTDEDLRSIETHNNNISALVAITEECEEERKEHRQERLREDDEKERARAAAAVTMGELTERLGS